MVVVVLLI